MASDYAYSLELSFGSTTLDAEALRQLVQLDYVESLEELDALMVRLEVTRGADAEKVMAMATPGTPWTLTLTTDEGTLEAGGDLVEAGCTFARNGFWSVTLHGLEALHRLRGGQPPSLWPGAWTDAVKKIASRHGLTAKVEGADGAPAFTLQADEDDAMFVKRVARELNYYARVVDKQLIFGRRNVAQGSKISLEGKELRRFAMTASVYDVVSKVTVVGHDASKDEVVKADADKAKLKKISGGKTGPELSSSFGTRLELVHNAGCTVPSLAQALATGRMQRAGESLVRGSLQIDGNPSALSGHLVAIDAVPWPATGPFLIHQTRHTIQGRMYTTEISFLSDSLPSTL